MFDNSAIDSRPALFLREWLTLAFFFAFFFAIVLFSFMENREKSVLIQNVKADAVRVYIEGEVKNPGLFVFAPGTTRRTALEEAGLKETSIIETIDLNKKVQEGERIKIRARKMIKISLQYPGKLVEELELPKGAKISEVQMRMEGTPYQVQWHEKRRTVLREGDSISLNFR